MSQASPAARRGDPLIWISRKLHAALDRPATPIGVAALHALDGLVDVSSEVQRLRRLYRLALSRGWTLAAGTLAARLSMQVVRLRDAAMSAAASRPDQRLRPTLSDLYQDLVALESEFGTLDLDRRQRIIGVVTEPLMLEGIQLGPFTIELRFANLESRSNPAGAFACVALEPHPPACSSATTHPHIRDDQPCLGEAGAAVATALRDGRVLDAFLAVAAVLRNYNPGSPYVALEDWYGESCSDCGGLTAEDDLHHCGNCGCRCCDGCSSFCDACTGSFCNGCLERAEDDENLCQPCRGRCEECDAIARRSTLRDNDGRCDGCVRDNAADDDDEGLTAPAAALQLVGVTDAAAATPADEVRVRSVLAETAVV